MNGPLSFAQGDHLLLAARWIEAALLGSVATFIAVVAIAVTGFAMLRGRIDFLRGAMVVIGCFVLFGAPAVATGLLRLSSSDGEVATSLPPAPIAPPSPATPPANYDPYAGAAVPRSR